MSVVDSISPDNLFCLVGTPACPVPIDVRIDDEFKADPRLIPGSVRRSHTTAAEWAPTFSGRLSWRSVRSVQVSDEFHLARRLRARWRSAQLFDGPRETWQMVYLER